jgi:hypothetical protein
LKAIDYAVIEQWNNSLILTYLVSIVFVKTSNIIVDKNREGWKGYLIKAYVN